MCCHVRSENLKTIQSMIDGNNYIIEQTVFNEKWTKTYNSSFIIHTLITSKNYRMMPINEAHHKYQYKWIGTDETVQNHVPKNRRDWNLLSTNKRAGTMRIRSTISRDDKLLELVPVKNNKNIR